MSYLDPVRLHFAGQFQADPSTVNNVTSYYDNEHFKKEFQQRPAGLWNPDGSGSWRLVDCRVTRVCYADGSSTTDPAVDPVVGMRLMDANKRVAGKLVDLDPQQQMVSQIWSLIVRLTDGTDDFFSGLFETASFCDLWQRAMEAGRFRQQPLSAFYQSVLAPVTWGDTSGSRFLGELRGAAGDMLSIKFNVDGYDRDNTIPTFTLGRIVGSIGPAAADEPHHFILGRHLGGGTDIHTNFMPCVVDTKTRRLTADFGNATATGKPGGQLLNLGDLAVGYIDSNSGRFVSIGGVSYHDKGWYESTAGVQAFPLTDDAIATLASSSVLVAINGQPVLQENVDGLHVRADQFVYRLAPGDSVDVQLYATEYGVLQDGAPIVVVFDPSQLQGSPTGNPPPIVGSPESAVTGFDANTPIVAQNGRAVLKLTASDAGPDNARGYIDGQVYGVRPLPQALVSNPPGSFVNPADFVSLLVWNAYEVPEAPAWYPDMQPIFTQYGNLYPLMDKLIDLTSYDAISESVGILTYVFSLPESDPNSMPVTRDLSPAKRKAILRWLNTPGPDGKPLLGTPPPKAAAVTFAVAAEAPAIPLASPQGSDLFLMKSGLDELADELVDELEDGKE
jgi:hypothetical protein